MGEGLRGEGEGEAGGGLRGERTRSFRRGECSVSARGRPSAAHSAKQSSRQTADISLHALRHESGTVGTAT
eukprot:scaffold56942_cov24-Tisochrysis_lutea.AAC.1